VISSSSIYKSKSESDSDSKVDNRPAQKKQKINNPQARTVRDDLLAVDDPILEGADCQDLYSSQDPYDESMKLFATASEDKPTNGRLKENSNVISVPQSHESDRSQSPYMTPALTALAAIVPQELIAAIDGQSATLAVTALMKSALSDPGIPQQIAEVTNDKQE
jgi:hypothetical protein